MRRVNYFLACATLCAFGSAAFDIFWGARRPTQSLDAPPAGHTWIDGQALGTERQWPLLERPAARLTPPEHEPTANPRWLADVGRELMRREYFASVNRHGLQAPNRAQDLRTYFEPGGVRITARTTPGEPELVRIGIRALGREGAMAEVVAGQVSHEDGRVEITRQGLTEWYENSDRGLEQGVTLAARPAGDTPLVVDLRIDGAQVSEAGGVVTLACVGGRTLRYGELAAHDARGVRLPAHLEAAEGSVRIVTADAGAAYPVTIDPLISNTTDGRVYISHPGEQFARHVASAGDVNGDGFGDIVVGTEFFDAGETDEGCACIFLGSVYGISTSTAPAATITSNQVQGFMGRGIASGDFNGDGYSDLVVGAYGYDLGQAEEGVAFVFNGGPSGIPNGSSPATASATLQCNSVGAVFGYDVQCAGDVNGDGYEDAIVGAENYNGTGAAFIFTGSASGIASASPATSLVCNQVSSSFGYAIAGAGDVNGDGYSDVIVGAYRYDAAQTNQGAAFFWRGGPSGIASGSQATAFAMLQVSTADIQFGTSVAGAGDVNGDGYSDVIVGAPFYANGQASEGAVFLYLGYNTGLLNNQSFANRIESDQASANMGSQGTIAGAGDVNGDGYADVLCGVAKYDHGQTDEGSAFVFLGCNTGVLTTSAGQAWAELQGNQLSAQFGVSVAANDVNGDGYSDVIVGCPLWDGLSGADEGAAFVALGGARVANVTAVSARALLQSNQTGTPEFGFSVAGAGDVNGDGFSDVIVGAPFYDLGETDEGAAFVFLGGLAGVANGSPATAATTLQSNDANDELGYSVAGAGDVNGDGFADVIVGSPGYLTNAGAAYVFAGRASGVASGNPGTAMAALTGTGGSSMGHSVGGAGDVNGDGYADVIVGAYKYFAGVQGPSPGAAFIYHGSNMGIASANTASAATQLISTFDFGQFGASVASAGDVNGDGYSDVIVGAPFYGSGGAAFVFHGSSSGVPSGDPTTAHSTIQPNQASAALGISVAGAGDVDGDGYDDVIVGASFYGASDEGAAWVFLGDAGGVPTGNPSLAYITISNGSPASHLGASVASAGDMNGDGYADVIVGSPDYISQGFAYVYFGSQSPAPPPAPPATLASAQSGAYGGGSVAGAGDVDGDGFADAIVGAMLYDSGQTDEGVAYVCGGGGLSGTLPGRPRLARQFRGNGQTQMVPPLGASYDDDQFGVAMNGIDARGRAQVKLEVEHCPPGSGFGAIGCTRTVATSWTDAGANPNGAALSLDLSPVAGGAHRWRARTLIAPFNVTQPGITAPAKPVHGPWRRLQGQGIDSDVRVTPGIVGVEIRHDPAGFAIEHLVNPTRGRIEFTAVLPGNEPAKAELFDVAGRRWLARDLRVQGTSRADFRWDEGRALPSGTYLLRLSQGGRAATAHLVVVH